MQSQSPGPKQQQALREAAEAMLSNPQSELLEGVPKGTLMHRNWACPTLKVEREAHVDRDTIIRANAGSRWDGHLEWVRGLTPMMPKPTLQRACKESFHWVVRPAEDLLQGSVYTDGSMLDGPDLLTARCGCSFAVIGDSMDIVASARGVRPPWVYDIHGAEVWALIQAAMRAFPGMTEFLCDCESVVSAIKAGRRTAFRADKMHARAYSQLFAVLDDVIGGAFTWLPAHKTEDQVGVVLKGDGTTLTAKDLEGNRDADRLAKLAVAEHRVSSMYVERWTNLKRQAESTARWAARAAELAYNSATFPHRDSTACRLKALQQKTKRNVKPHKHVTTHARRVQLGGHRLARVEAGTKSVWRCTACRVSSAAWSKIAGQRCQGSAVHRWAHQASMWADSGVVQGGGHTRVMSGDVIWCTTCGAYADTKAVGLSKPCKGPPIRAALSYGGAWGQLRKLHRGVHPRTGCTMPPTIDEQGRPFTPTSFTQGIYANTPASRQAAAFAGGMPPTPQPQLQCVHRRTLASLSGDGKTAKENMEERLQKIRAKEAAANAVRRRGQPVAAPIGTPPAQVRRRCYFKQPG